MDFDPTQIPPALLQQFFAQLQAGELAHAAPVVDDRPVPERVLDEVADARAEIADIVRQSNGMTETATLDIGRALNDIVTLSDAYVRNLHATFEELQSGDEEDGIVELIGAQHRTTNQFVEAVRQGSSEQKRVAEGAIAQAQSIMRIGTSINEVARNSKMLALNASIEAARLGVPGRSFAVIASEMQTLSERVHESNTLVRELVVGMMELLPRVLEGAQKLVDDTDHFRERIGSQTNRVHHETEKLSRALDRTSHDQDARLGDILTASQNALSQLQFQDPMAQRLMRIDRRLERMQRRLHAWFEDREADADIMGAMQVELGGGVDREETPESGELLLF